MASALVVGVLAWLHVLSAIGWFGSHLVLSLGFEPKLGDLSPDAREEVTMTMSPRLSKLEVVFASSTVVFGVLFLYALTGGDMALLSPSSSWGLAITVGATLGLLAFLLEVGVDYPSEKKVVAILKEMRAKGQTNQGELAKYHKRSEVSETLVTILMFAILVFMVAAGQL